MDRLRTYAQRRAGHRRRRDVRRGRRTTANGVKSTATTWIRSIRTRWDTDSDGYTDDCRRGTDDFKQLPDATHATTGPIRTWTASAMAPALTACSDAARAEVALRLRMTDYDEVAVTPPLPPPFAPGASRSASPRCARTPPVRWRQRRGSGASVQCCGAGRRRRRVRGASRNFRKFTESKARGYGHGGSRVVRRRAGRAASPSAGRACRGAVGRSASGPSRSVFPSGSISPETIDGSGGLVSRSAARVGRKIFAASGSFAGAITPRRRVRAADSSRGCLLAAAKISEMAFLSRRPPPGLGADARARP